MSRTARTVPADRARDLRAALAGEVADGHLLERASRRADGAQDHLQRPAEAAVADPQREQRLAPGGAHRAEVGERARRCGGAARTRAPRWRRGRAAATRRPAPAAARPSTRSALAGRDRVGDARQLARVERGVAVHEAHDLGASRPSGPAKQAAPNPGAARAPRGRPATRPARPSRRWSRCRRRSARSRRASARAPRAAPRARRARAGRRRASPHQATLRRRGGPILVTGGAGFIGSHVVDALLERGHAVRVVDALLPAAHRERPDYLDPRAEFIEGDLRDEAVAAGGRRGRGRGLPPGGDGRARRRHRRHRRLRRPQRPRHRPAAAARWPATASRAGSCSPRAWSSTARGATRAPSTASCGPARASPQALDAGRFEPPCPVCGRALEPRTVPEDAPLDPRNVYAATKVAQEHLCAAFSRETGVPVTALRYHNVYGPRMPRDTPYAGVASIFRSALDGGARAAGVRGRRPAARLRARARRRARQRARADRAGGRGGRLQRRQRHAAHGARHGAGARARRSTARRAGGDGAVARRRRAPRVRLRRRWPPSGSASARGEDFEGGMREFATAPLRA